MNRASELAGQVLQSCRVQLSDRGLETQEEIRAGHKDTTSTLARTDCSGEHVGFGE